MQGADTPGILLQELCHDLRRLWTQAGGPSLRVLGAQVGLGKSQAGAILGGDIRQPPDCDVVRGLVTGFQHYARAQGRTAQISLRTGVDEYWRPRYAVLEHAFRQRVRRATEADANGAAPPGAAVRRVGGGRPAGKNPVRVRRAAARMPRPSPPAVRPGRPRRTAAHRCRIQRTCHQLAALDALVPPDGPAHPGASTVIVTIGGSAGVGKTALAVHWAHRSRERFPDGRLHLGLHGFDHDRAPMRPQTALEHLLCGLGVPPADVPADLDGLMRAYRSRVSGRRLLLILDDAASAEQVRPLLPGSPSCHVVVTSRNRLGGLSPATESFRWPWTSSNPVKPVR